MLHRPLLDHPPHGLGVVAVVMRVPVAAVAEAQVAPMGKQDSQGPPTVAAAVVAVTGSQRPPRVGLADLASSFCPSPISTPQLFQAV